MPITAQYVADAIAARGFRVVPSRGRFRCQCPAHGGSDSGLNLDVHTGDTGRVLLYCHSHNCKPKAVLEAVGLSLADVAGDRVAGDEDRRQPYRDRGKPVARYPYRDAGGVVVLEQWRFSPKSFGPVFPQPDGSFKAGGGDSSRWPLFHLPELLAADPTLPVFIANGEKAVLTLERQGCVATCNPFGESQKWSNHPLWVEALSDRRCIILVDNDEPGRRHAEDVKEALEDSATSVRTLALRDLPPGGDVVDWFAAGHTIGELRDLIATARERLSGAIYTGPQVEALAIPEPEWLIDGYVSRANLTILAGPGKLGKSILGLQMTISAACGAPFIGVPVPAVRSLYINWEDNLALTRSRARLQMAGEPLPENWLVMDRPGGISLPEFLDFLGDYILKADVGLVVMDPLGIAAHWKNENDNAEVGPTIQSIQDVAARTEVAIVAVCHTRKSGGVHGEEVRGASALFNGVQGFLSFHRTEGNVFALDRLNKLSEDDMPTVHLLRDTQTKSWQLSGEPPAATSKAKGEKLSPPMTVLVLLGEQELLTAVEVSEKAAISESSSRRSLAQLIESGWVSQQEDRSQPGRPRVVHSLTGLGRRYLRAHQENKPVDKW